MVVVFSWDLLIIQKILNNNCFIPEGGLELDILFTSVFAHRGMDHTSTGLFMGHGDGCWMGQGTAEGLKGGKTAVMCKIKHQKFTQVKYLCIAQYHM